MAGLIAGNMSGQPTGQPSPEEDLPDDAAAEEFEDKFMYVVEAMLADKKADVAGKIVDMIESSKNLPQALANAAYDLVAAVDEKTGAMLDDGSLPAVAAETLGLVAEFAEAAGHKITSREVSAATQIMLQRFLAENGDDASAQIVGQTDPAAVGQQIDQAGVQ